MSYLKADLGCREEKNNLIPVSFQGGFGESQKIHVFVFLSLSVDEMLKIMADNKKQPVFYYNRQNILPLMYCIFYL